MKNKCLTPIVLKNGTVVPCGKCEICRANARLEWQYRLRIHLMSCDTMPLFITLTYDDDNLPLCDPGDSDRIWKRRCWPAWNDFHEKYYTSSVLDRWDISQFIRKYKRKYSLYKTDFAFFGCGERGDMFSRPHFHLLFFGDRDLYSEFMLDSERAQKRVLDVWQKGHVHVGIAGYDGMAYCTKYVLKSNPEEYVLDKPFTVASKGLGMNFLNSKKAEIIRKTLDYAARYYDSIIDSLPAVDFHNKRSIKRALEVVQKYVPDFSVVLDDGTKVFLPRAIRRKLTGSFEHFKDNPLWLYNHLKTCLESIEYYENFGDYDALHYMSYSAEQSYQRILKMRVNKNINNYNKQFKKV